MNLLIVLLLLIVGALPTWPYSKGWGTLARRTFATPLSRWP
jgi:hypothetical protein